MVPQDRLEACKNFFGLEKDEVKLHPRTRQIFAWNSTWLACMAIFAPNVGILGGVAFNIYGLFSFLAWQPVRSVMFMALDVMCSLAMMVIMLSNIRNNVLIVPFISVAFMFFSFSSHCKNKGYHTCCAFGHLIFRVCCLMGCTIIWGHFANLETWKYFYILSILSMSVLLEILCTEYDSNIWRESFRSLIFFPFYAYLVNPDLMNTSVITITSTSITMIMFYTISLSSNVYVKIHDGNQYIKTDKKLPLKRRSGYGSIHEK